jgi:uncharacterized membrane protein
VPLESFFAILGMTVATFATKAGGFLLAGRLPQSGFIALWLRHVPGAVLAALVAPAIINGGLPETVAAIATAAAYLLTRNLFPAMIAGVGTVFLMRMVLGG